jgi:hypothetical protein
MPAELWLPCFLLIQKDGALLTVEEGRELLAFSSADAAGAFANRASGWPHATVMRVDTGAQALAVFGQLPAAVRFIAVDPQIWPYGRGQQIQLAGCAERCDLATTLAAWRAGNFLFGAKPKPPSLGKQQWNQHLNLPPLPTPRAAPGSLS